MQLKNYKKGPSTILPFPSWLEQTYPKKTAVRSFLRVIGALDLGYVMYRMGTKGKEGIEGKKGIEGKGGIKDKKGTINAAIRGRSIATQTMIAIPQIEPEPLILQEDPIISTPAAVVPSRGKHAMWLADPSLEDLDLRKLAHPLETHGVTLAFDILSVDDEEETVIVVNDIAWKAMLASPALNLSKMLQIIRVSYGELYVLGRMALGAMSGEGYMSSDEATKIIEALASATDKAVVLDVQYHNKDATSKKRSLSTVSIRFERIL